MFCPLMISQNLNIIFWSTKVKWSPKIIILDKTEILLEYFLPEIECLPLLDEISSHYEMITLGQTEIVFTIDS